MSSLCCSIISWRLHWTLNNNNISEESVEDHKEHSSRDSWQSSHIILSGFLEECYMCHMLVRFFFFIPVLIRACNHIQSSLQICSFWSPTTLLQHSLSPLTEKRHLSQFWPALSFGPLPVGPLICTEWNILLWHWGLAAHMLMPECGQIGLYRGTFARHWDYRCDGVKIKTKHERHKSKTKMQ